MKANFKKFNRFFSRKELSANVEQVPSNERELFKSEVLLNEFMTRERPYLQRMYSIYQLSEETGIQVTHLTLILDRNGYAAFCDFIEGYRVGYCLELLKRIPPGVLSVFDLSVICGFGDQKDFSTAFKKIMHVSVSKYIRSVRPGLISNGRSGSGQVLVLLLFAVAALHILKYHYSSHSESTIIPAIMHQKALPKKGRANETIVSGNISYMRAPQKRGPDP